MKLKILSVFVLSILLLLSSACIVTSHDYNMELSCEDFTEASHYHTNYELEVGDKIRLELCSNATTGFQWEYQMILEGVLQEEDHDHKEPENELPGAAGLELWTFEAVGVGETEVEMKYSQPWEGGEKEVWTYTMTVTVK